MDGTGVHYAKWNKPGCERQIPYDLTFNWNIINKKKEQNITRDTEVKNNLTIARGEWGGDSGERGYRNYYKGHLDKIKGEGGDGGGKWVQVGGWRDGKKKQRTVIE